MNCTVCSPHHFKNLLRIIRHPLGWTIFKQDHKKKRLNTTMNHKVLLQWITYNLTSDFKAEVGSLVFVSSGKNSTATFQQIVIQVV